MNAPEEGVLLLLQPIESEKREGRVEREGAP